ncbi:MAG: sigma-70 family RNA polymerase sigma factor [Pirellulales bacterium]|nr:sigma-70 family RNA polymerase sigma factor [Pirellulales bacterium]
MSGSDPHTESPSSEQAEFHRLFVQSQRRIFGYILTLLPRLADAEEVFQQSCVVMLGKASQFAPGTDFVGWACQIAQYEVYNYRRRLQNERLCFNENLLDRISARYRLQGDRLDAELDALKGCVEQLSPTDRQLIRQRYSRKITARALAAELGRPANTVYKAIQRIRRNLRECVERTVSRQDRTYGPNSPAEEERP